MSSAECHVHLVHVESFLACIVAYIGKMAQDVGMV